MDENQTQKFFDLRRLIGILLTTYGVILTVYGLFFNPQTESVTINIDLLWGILILIIGVIFLLVSLRPPVEEEEE